MDATPVQMSGVQPNLSNSFTGNNFHQPSNSLGPTNVNSGAGFGPLFGNQSLHESGKSMGGGTANQLANQTPISIQNNNMFEMQHINGQLSYRGASAGSKGGAKRGRPISAYPVPGNYPGVLSHISESVESTQASHLSRFTHNLARNHASRK